MCIRDSLRGIPTSGIRRPNPVFRSAQSGGRGAGGYAIVRADGRHETFFRGPPVVRRGGGSQYSVRMYRHCSPYCVSVSYTHLDVYKRQLLTSLSVKRLLTRLFYCG